MPAATLHVVATPIGNLGDLSPRAQQVLREVAAVCAEDTRRSGQLLAHFGIGTPLLALHEHNEQQLAERLVARLLGGEALALVSDAGTPLVSDPGYRLVRAARAAGVKVSPVPGPSALVAALSVAGLPSDRFTFEGFLPAKASARRERLAALAGEPRTLVFYESSHRIEESLADLRAAFGDDRPAVLARERGQLRGLSVALTNVGLAEAALGQVDAGAAHVREAIAIAGRLGNGEHEAGMTGALVDIYEAAGRYREAFAALRRQRGLEC